MRWRRTGAADGQPHEVSHEHGGSGTPCYSPAGAGTAAPADARAARDGYRPARSTCTGTCTARRRGRLPAVRGRHLNANVELTGIARCAWRVAAEPEHPGPAPNDQPLHPTVWPAQIVIDAPRFHRGLRIDQRFEIVDVRVFVSATR